MSSLIYTNTVSILLRENCNCLANNDKSLLHDYKKITYGNHKKIFF